MDRDAALALLGVKAQTLYAYVSRGRIEVRRESGGPKRSLYRAEDVARLVTHADASRRPADIAARSMAWGEASLVTHISTVQHGRLIYRGEDAASFSDRATLEDAARLLWDYGERVDFSGPANCPANPFEAVAALASHSQSTLGRGQDRLCRDASEAIGHLAAGCGVNPGDAPLHERLGVHWGLSAEPREWVRRALVLVADHELNASTFACRVAASTGAPLAASLLAGLAALSGPRHGGATKALTALLKDAVEGDAQTVVQSWLDGRGQVPGFGHPLYPNGDIRAGSLIAQFDCDRLMQDVVACVRETTGERPNIDFALVALARAAGLPDTAPFTLFLLGRSVGWAAHAMEQVREGSLIRPRARYEGKLPAFRT